MNSIDIKISQNFKTLRSVLGISQVKLANTINVSNSYISAIEKGKPKKISDQVFNSIEFKYGIKQKTLEGGTANDIKEALKTAEPSENIKRIYSRACDIERPGGDMLAHFNNKKRARVCIDKLLEIDKIEPEKLEPVEMFLCGFLEGLKPQKKMANNS